MLLWALESKNRIFQYETQNRFVYDHNILRNLKQNVHLRIVITDSCIQYAINVKVATKVLQYLIEPKT